MASSKSSVLKNILNCGCTHVTIIGGNSNYPINYMLNCRSGSTTFKSSLLNGISSTEKFIPEDFSRPLFSVVRNPYSRVLSQYTCYRDDFMSDGIISVGMHEFAKSNNLEVGNYKEWLTFDIYIEILYDLMGYIHIWDHHYRPQSLNLLHGLIRPSFIGHLEDMETVKQYLKNYNLIPKFKSWRTTNSSTTYKDKIRRGDSQKNTKNIQEDFIVYDYDPDLTSNHIPKPIKQSQHLNDRVLLCILLSNLLYNTNQSWIEMLTKAYGESSRVKEITEKSRKNLMPLVEQNDLYLLTGHFYQHSMFYEARLITQISANPCSRIMHYTTGNMVGITF